MLQRVVDHGRPERVLEVLSAFATGVKRSGRPDGVRETLLRRLVDSGHPDAGPRAAWELAGRGTWSVGTPRPPGLASLEELTALLRRVAESGHANLAAPAAFGLAGLLDASRRPDEARIWWRRAAQLVGWSSELPHRADRTPHTDSTAVLRRYVEVGRPTVALGAAELVAAHLNQQGDPVGAEDVLRRALDRGRVEDIDFVYTRVMHVLADLLHERHRPLHAEHLAGPDPATRHPARLLVAALIAALVNREPDWRDDVRRLYAQLVKIAPYAALGVHHHFFLYELDDPRSAVEVGTQLFGAATDARDWTLAREAAYQLALTLPVGDTAGLWEVYRRLAAELPDDAARMMRLYGRGVVGLPALAQKGTWDDGEALLDSADPELAGYAALFLARLCADCDDRTGRRRALETAAQIGTPEQAIEATAALIGLLLEPGTR